MSKCYMITGTSEGLIDNNGNNFLTEIRQLNAYLFFVYNA